MTNGIIYWMVDLIEGYVPLIRIGLEGWIP